MQARLVTARGMGTAIALAECGYAVKWASKCRVWLPRQIRGFGSPTVEKATVGRTAVSPPR